MREMEQKVSENTCVPTKETEKRLMDMDNTFRVQRPENKIDKILTWIYRIVILGVLILILINQISNQGIGRYKHAVIYNKYGIFDTNTGRYHTSEPPMKE